MNLEGIEFPSFGRLSLSHLPAFARTVGKELVWNGQRFICIDYHWQAEMAKLSISQARNHAAFAVIRSNR